MKNDECQMTNDDGMRYLWRVR